MAKSYYSTVMEEPADQVWAVIRDFNGYRVWVEGADSHIEDGRSGEEVGAIRQVKLNGSVIRQRLLALSDPERSLTYEFCGPAPFPVRNFAATLRVTPVVDGDRAFVEWWASFDCAADEYDHWTGFFARSFQGWLGSLRGRLSTRGD